MRKKGFTLIELLAVIVILGLILAIAVPSVNLLIDNTVTNGYSINEKIVKKAAYTYFSANLNNLNLSPTDIKIVKISDLISTNYLSSLKDPKDRTSDCIGYVQYRLSIDNTIEITPNIKCGSNYITDGYLDEYMNPNTLSSVEVLVVAGGGGGGFRHGAGGGAGGLIYNTNYSISENVSIFVGAGGMGAISSGIRSTNGQNSIFGSLTAIGGGGGGQWDSYGNGLNGGSGGGSAGSGSRSSGTAGQGYAGGINSTGGHPYNHGGGGGAGSSGQDGTAVNCGDGGVGLYIDAFSTYGEAGYFSGGGAGGSHDPIPTDGMRGSGGLGGGGDSGFLSINSPGEDGIPNTGGGGGGASTPGGGNARGGNGGSGIVLVRYPGIQKANGGIVTSTGGYTIHTFKMVGNDTFELLTY